MSSSRKKRPDGENGLKPKDFAPLAAILGRHATAVVATAVSSNLVVATGVNPYLAYGFGLLSLATYTWLVTQERH